MTKRLTNTNAYKVRFIGERAGLKVDKLFTIVLERIKNTAYGNPRFKAIIIPEETDYTRTAVYTFTGHYQSEQVEASWILKQHLCGKWSN